MNSDHARQFLLLLVLELPRIPFHCRIVLPCTNIIIYANNNRILFLLIGGSGILRTTLSPQMDALLNYNNKILQKMSGLDHHCNISTWKYFLKNRISGRKYEVASFVPFWNVENFILEYMPCYQFRRNLHQYQRKEK